MTLAANRLRVGLVGAGRMGARTDDKTRAIVPAGWLPLSHAEAIEADQQLELVAICDTNEDQARSAAQRYGVARVFRDYREMITEMTPDLLAVATRTSGRCEILEFAATHGVRGIHVEKPLSNSMEDARRALTAVRQHGVKLTYGAGRRYMGAYRKAKQMVSDGAIGTLAEIRISFGRTLLMWNHPHSVDLILYFSDSCQVLDIHASCQIPDGSASGLTIDADPMVEWGVVHFANGVTGLISSASGFTVDLAGERGILSIVGDGAYLELRQIAPSGYLAAPIRVEFVPGLSGTQQTFRELAAAVRGEPGLVMSVDELLQSQAILLSLARSSMLCGAGVSLTALDERFTVTGRWGEKYA